MTRTTNDNKCNGWTNHETWAVNLWITNESSSNDYYLEMAETNKAMDRDPWDLAQQIKDEIDAYRPELSGMYADLLGAALSSVDWLEIANAFLSDNQR
jgi:hypothetical protein